MPRLVVLHFDDNGAAEALLANAAAHEAVPVALYATPVNFCECGKQYNKRWVIGQKFGWRVHRGCGKPDKGYNVMKNLIPSPWKELGYRFACHIDALRHYDSNGRKLP